MSDTGAHRSTSADEALARIQDGISRARDRADGAAGFRSRYEALTATGHSRQDGVRVTLDASSLVTAVSISDEGASRSGRQVAAAVLRAHGDAVRQLRNDVNLLAVEAFGAGSATTAALLAELPPAPSDDLTPRSTW